MKEQLEQRLHQLQQEFESGQQMLAELEQRQQTLKETMLRISGAMQVLQEFLQSAENGAATKEVLKEVELGHAAPPIH